MAPVASADDGSGTYKRGREFRNSVVCLGYTRTYNGLTKFARRPPRSKHTTDFGGRRRRRILWLHRVVALQPGEFVLAEGCQQDGIDLRQVRLPHRPSFKPGVFRIARKPAQGTSCALSGRSVFGHASLLVMTARRGLILSSIHQARSLVSLARASAWRVQTLLESPGKYGGQVFQSSARKSPDRASIYACATEQLLLAAGRRSRQSSRADD